MDGLSENEKRPQKTRPMLDEFCVPEGMPDHATSDGLVSSRQVVGHLAKGNRYVIKVTGDSMELRIQDGGLILIDYVKSPAPEISSSPRSIARRS